MLGRFLEGGGSVSNVEVIYIFFIRESAAAVPRLLVSHQDDSACQGLTMRTRFLHLVLPNLKILNQKDTDLRLKALSASSSSILVTTNP